MDSSCLCMLHSISPSLKKRMSIHSLELGCIRNVPPSDLEIALRQSLRPLGAKSLPRQISRSSGGVFSNTSLLSAVYCYTLLLTMFIAFQKIWEYLSWIKNAIDSKCFPPLRREVCPLWGNMTRRHNGTINDQAGKQKHHPLYFLFLTIWVLFLKYRGFHGNIYKARAALKCCNKSFEMERNHVICGL